MAPATTLEVAPGPIPAPTPPTLSRNPSISSFHSMATIALCPAGERTLAHGARSPSAPKNNHAAGNHSSLSEKLHHAHLGNETINISCPHCSKPVPVAKQLLPNLPKSSGEKAPAGAEPATAAERLYKTFASLDTTLTRHGADLHHIELLMPRHVSRAPSIYSCDETCTGADAKENLDLGAANPRILGLQEEQSARVASNTAHHSDAERMAAHPGHHSNLQNVHPLLYDVDDLKHLTAGVTRLLKTLHVKVSKLDEEEKSIRAERERLEKEREEIRRLRRELEEERTELIKEKDDMAVEREVQRHEISGSYNSLERSGSGQTETSESNTNPDEPNDAANALWSAEKDGQLATLEQRLEDANRRWKDEQEEIAGPLASLKQERRKARKMLRRGSLRLDTADGKSPWDKLGRQSSMRSFARRGSTATMASEVGSPKDGRPSFLRLWGSRSNKKKQQEEDEQSQSP